MQPFVQALQNPHFSVAHGLVLIALVLLVRAERTGRTSAYVAAGGVGLFACASRPYDLIPFAVVLPLLHLFSGDVFDLRRGVRRLSTLIMLLPCAYPLWVLWRNPDFRPWAVQGVMPVVPLHAYAILLGVPALVLAARVVKERRLAFDDPVERVMWLWGGTVLLLSQANRFTSLLPWSPQILVTSMAPIVMFAVPALTRVTTTGLERGNRVLLIALILAIALPSSAITVSRRVREAKSYDHLFVSDGERAGWEWLAEQVEPSDVILATPLSSLRLPRHVPAHVIAGHWAVSPEYQERAAQALRFFRGRMPPDEAAEFSRRFGVDWIWVGPFERTLGGWSRADFAPDFRPCYERSGVRIYRCGDER